MTLNDVILLLHPVFAVVVVFPLIGMVLNRSILTRRRRLQTSPGKSKIPPQVGPEHVQMGRWLTGSVVSLALLGLAAPIGRKILETQLWTTNPFQVIFIVGMFLATIGSLILLYRAKPWYWRATFAGLTSLGVIILGLQDGVFRRDDEWFVSHFYYGMIATVLMILSLAMVQDIYRDRTQVWRRIHILLNCVATLLFLGQGITGTRDLLEIPLSWQKPHLYRCDFANQTCPDVSSQLPIVSPPLV